LGGREDTQCFLDGKSTGETVRHVEFDSVVFDFDDVGFEWPAIMEHNGGQFHFGCRTG
jgi:hypothetical protein